jgi:hypothetical protein
MEAASGWIDRVEFPATKIELIDAAEAAGAPDSLIEQLQQLRHEQYESRADVDSELAEPGDAT